MQNLDFTRTHAHQNKRETTGMERGRAGEGGQLSACMGRYRDKYLWVRKARLSW